MRSSSSTSLRSKPKLAIPIDSTKKSKLTSSTGSNHLNLSSYDFSINAVKVGSRGTSRSPSKPTRSSDKRLEPNDEDVDEIFKHSWKRYISPKRDFITVPSPKRVDHRPSSPSSPSPRSHHPLPHPQSSSNHHQTGHEERHAYLDRNQAELEERIQFRLLARAFHEWKSIWRGSAFIKVSSRESKTMTA
jgi:hypothetical protein